MKLRNLVILLLVCAVVAGAGILDANQSTPVVKLGNERLMTEYHYLIEGKKVGLVTNQSGVNRQGKSTIDLLAEDPSTRLVALYGPEHGIDGTARAGEYVEPIPTANWAFLQQYGQTRMPTEECSGILICCFLIFRISGQDPILTCRR